MVIDVREFYKEAMNSQVTRQEFRDMVLKDFFDNAYRPFRLKIQNRIRKALTREILLRKLPRSCKPYLRRHYRLKRLVQPQLRL